MVSRASVSESTVPSVKSVSASAGPAGSDGRKRSGPTTVSSMQTPSAPSAGVTGWMRPIESSTMPAQSTGSGLT